MTTNENIPEDSREAVVEGLRKTKQIVGPLFPAIVEKGTMNVLDGNTRKRSDPTWPEREVEITDPKQRILIPLFANYRRRVPREETQGQILHLIELLNREGVADEQMTAKICELLPFSERYIRSLMPSKFKKTEKAHKQDEKFRPPVLTEEEEKETTKFKMADGRTMELPSKSLEVMFGTVTCPSCRTALDSVTCPRCMTDIPIDKIKGKSK